VLLGYIGPVMGYLDQRAELRDETARLATLERERDGFKEQLAALDQPAVLEARARALGLIEPGEKAYLVRGNLDPPPATSAGHDDGGPLGWLSGIF
jgi:hypothetical protein